MTEVKQNFDENKQEKHTELFESEHHLRGKTSKGGAGETQTEHIQPLLRLYGPEGAFEVPIAQCFSTSVVAEP